MGAVEKLAVVAGNQRRCRQVERHGRRGPGDGQDAHHLVARVDERAVAAARSRARACKAVAAEDKAAYFLRHAPVADLTNAIPTYLHVFGANLDIKNMEYKNFDDDAAESRAETA